MANWNWDFTYRELSPFFYQDVVPDVAPNPELIVFNERLAQDLGLDLDNWAADRKVEDLSGNRCPAGSRPLAQAYAGHQFGHFTMLGDGRALLLGEVVTPSGKRFDVQLKGSGKTPYSRGGDGKAALGPMIREYLMSEALFGLGVPTNRALAVVKTGSTVYREKALPGAVLTRVASSHIRVGTFEYAAVFGDEAKVLELLNYAIERHFPDAKDSPHPAEACLREVAKAQGRLLALWQHMGFVHGVMNTDNMTISGETIDFGPCAFMDSYGEQTVFSSIDTNGRYAFGRQPEMALWNLERLAACLLPLLGDNAEMAQQRAQGALELFVSTFRLHWSEILRNRLGLMRSQEGDETLMRDWIQLVSRYRPDYTLAHRALCELTSSSNEVLVDALAGVRDFFATSDTKIWLARWRDRLSIEGVTDDSRQEHMRRFSPAVIARNHLVEGVIEKAMQGDFGPLYTAIEVFQNPYSKAMESNPWAFAPPSGLAPYRTTCGT